MTPIKKQNGFTIIEVLLFLALSALFLIIAFVGVGSRSQQVQFTDSMRSLQSFLQKQQNDILNGVNAGVEGSYCTDDASGKILLLSDVSAVGGQSDCALLGRLVLFSPNSSVVSVHTVLGRLLSSARPAGSYYLDPSLSDLQLIDKAVPHAMEPQLKHTYDIEWQSKFTFGFNNTKDVPIKGIGFIRSPGSTNILNFAVLDCLNINNNIRLNFGSGGGCSLPIGSDVAARLCFEGSNGQLATMRIGGVVADPRSDSIEIRFDEENALGDCLAP